MVDQNPTIEKLADRTIITLPKRNIKEIAKFGWIAIGFGGLAAFFSIAWCLIPLSMALGALKGGQPIVAIFPIIFATFGLPGLYFALKVLTVGIGVVRNDTWTSIAISPHRIVIQEHFWKFSWKRKFKELPSRNLVIDSLSRKGANREETPIPFGLSKELFGLAAKRIKKDSKREPKPSPLIIGYERHVIDAVVDALQDAIGLGTLTVESSLEDEAKNSMTTTGIKTSELVVDDLRDQDLTFKPIEKPDDTIISVDEMGDATVYRVPPIGILKVGFFFWFSIIWLAFSSILFSAILASMFGGNIGGNNNGAPIWVIIPFGSVFVVIGIALLVAAINIGRRSSIIGVANGLLWIERNSIFGKKTMQFESENIIKIAMRPSGTTVNDVPVMELQILAADGRKVGMLSQLSEPEIEWIADSLRRLLDIREKPTRFVPDAATQKAMTDPSSIPHSWRIDLTESPKSLSIFVRPMSWLAAFPLHLTGLVFVGVGIFIFTGAANGNLGLNFPFGVLEIAFGFVFFFLGVLCAGLPSIYTRRKFQFEIDLHSLKVTRFRLKETDVFEFKHSEIKKIHGGDGSLKVNNEPQPLLEIIRMDGSREAFLMWRKPAMVLFVIAKLNSFRQTKRLVENEKSTYTEF